MAMPSRPHVTFVNGPLEGHKTRIHSAGAAHKLMAPTSFWVRVVTARGHGPEAAEIIWRTGDEKSPKGAGWSVYKFTGGGSGESEDTTRRCSLVPAELVEPSALDRLGANEKTGGRR